MKMLTRICTQSLLVVLLVSGLTASADPVAIESQAAMLRTLGHFNGSVLFLGHGSKGQFADMTAVHASLDAVVARLNGLYGVGGWVAVFGGDNFNAEKPDIGAVMKYLKDAHQVPLMAIQSDIVIQWGGVDKHLDYVRYIPTVQLPALTDQGQPVIENGKPKMKTHWGGLIDGVPKGPSEVYLGQDLIGGEHPILKEVVAVGGGPIGLEEARYAYDHGIPVTYVRAEARYPEVNGRFGFLDDWARELGGSFDTHKCVRLLSGKK